MLSSRWNNPKNLEPSFWIVTLSHSRPDMRREILSGTHLDTKGTWYSGPEKLKQNIFSRKLNEILCKILYESIHLWFEQI